jgi:hypothetical protein
MGNGRISGTDPSAFSFLGNNPSIVGLPQPIAGTLHNSTSYPPLVHGQHSQLPNNGDPFLNQRLFLQSQSIAQSDFYQQQQQQLHVQALMQQVQANAYALQGMFVPGTPQLLPTAGAFAGSVAAPAMPPRMINGSGGGGSSSSTFPLSSLYAGFPMPNSTYYPHTNGNIPGSCMPPPSIPSAATGTATGPVPMVYGRNSSQRVIIPKPGERGASRRGEQSSNNSGSSGSSSSEVGSAPMSGFSAPFFGGISGGTIGAGLGVGSGDSGGRMYLNHPHQVLLSPPHQPCYTHYEYEGAGEVMLRPPQTSPEPALLQQQQGQPQGLQQAPHTLSSLSQSLAQALGSAVTATSAGTSGTSGESLAPAAEPATTAAPSTTTTGTTTTGSSLTTSASSSTASTTTSSSRSPDGGHGAAKNVDLKAPGLGSGPVNPAAPGALRAPGAAPTFRLGPRGMITKN